MPDITTRYRLELDSVGLMGQLAAVEAQAGGQIAQMAQPIQSSILQTFQTGTNALMAAQGSSLRAASYFPGSGGVQAAAGALGAASSMFGIGGGGGYSAARTATGDFFAPDLAAAGQGRGLVGTGLRAMGIMPARDYEYTPEENRYRYGQQFTRQLENAALGTARTGLEMAGSYGGYSLGSRVGGAIGRGLFGEAGEVIGGSMGAMAGARWGHQLYGVAGGATLGAGLGGALGGAIGNIPGLSSVPVLGSLLSGIGAVTGGIGSAVGGLLGGTAGGVGQMVMETIGRRNALRPLIESIGMTSGAGSGNALGPGFSQEESQRIGRDVNKMLAKDYRYGVEDYAKIMKGGADAGAYESSGTAQGFTRTTEKLVNDVKTIQTALRKNVDDSIAVMQQIISSNGTRADVSGIAAQLRGLSKSTGLSPDQLLQYGITTPTFGATQLLGGVPGVASDIGVSRARVMEAGMSGAAMSKGQFLDELGFSTGIATLGGAQRMFEAGGLDRSLVASAGGVDRLAQKTQGALQSWMQSGSAKWAAMGGRPPQTLPDMIGFELDYALKASQMSPADIAGSMRKNAENIAGMVGGLGPRGADYVMFKQLKQQGYGDIDAIAIMRNQGNVQAGAGAIQAKPIEPEYVSLDDESRERGFFGGIRRMGKGFEQLINNTWDAFAESDYDPAMRSLSQGLGRVSMNTTGRESLPALAGSAVATAVTGAGALLGAGGGLLSEGLRRAAPAVRAVGREFVGGLGLSPDRYDQAADFASGTVGLIGAAAGGLVRGAGRLYDAFTGPSMPHPLGMMLGQSYDAAPRTPGFEGRPAERRDPIAPPGGVTITHRPNELHGEATTPQLAAPVLAGAGAGIASQSASTGLGLLDRVTQEQGDEISEEGIKAGVIAMRSSGATEEAIKEWSDAQWAKIQSRRAARARTGEDKPKEAKPEEVAKVPAPGSITPGTAQLQAAPGKGTPRQQELSKVLQGVEAGTAWSVLQKAGLGLERAGLDMLQAGAFGAPVKSAEELRKKILAGSKMGTVGKDGEFHFNRDVSAERQAGLLRGAAAITESLWDPAKGHPDWERAGVLSRGAGSLIQHEKRWGGISADERSAGEDSWVAEGFLARLGGPGGAGSASVYSRLREGSEKGTTGIVSEITELGRKAARDPNFRKELGQTKVGQLASLSYDLTGMGEKTGMEQIQAKLEGSGFFSEAQIKDMTKKGLRGEDLAKKALETAVQNEGETGAGGSKAQQVADTLMSALRAILDLARH